jgi:hypothetical protein
MSEENNLPVKDITKFAAEGRIKLQEEVELQIELTAKWRENNLSAIIAPKLGDVHDGKMHSTAIGHLHIGCVQINNAFVLMLSNCEIITEAALSDKNNVTFALDTNGNIQDISGEGRPSRMNQLMDVFAQAITKQENNFSLAA